MAFSPQSQTRDDLFIFNQIDADGDGIISKEDLAQVMQPEFGEIDEDHFSGVYQALADENGKITKTSFTEGLLFWRECTGERSSESSHERISESSHERISENSQLPPSKKSIKRRESSNEERISESSQPLQADTPSKEFIRAPKKDSIEENEEIEEFEEFVTINTEKTEKLLQAREREVAILKQKLKHANRKLVIVKKANQQTQLERQRLSTNKKDLHQALEKQKAESQKDKKKAEEYKKLFQSTKKEMLKTEEEASISKVDHQSIMEELGRKTVLLEGMRKECNQLRIEMDDKSKQFKLKELGMKKNFKAKLRREKEEKRKCMKQIEELQKHTAMMESRSQEAEDLRKVKKQKDREVIDNPFKQHNSLIPSLAEELGLDLSKEVEKQNGQEIIVAGEEGDEGDEDDEDDKNDEGDKNECKEVPTTSKQTSHTRRALFFQALKQKPKVETMDKLLDKAYTILQHWSQTEFTDANKYADAKLIHFLLRSARGVIFLTQIRAGFIVGGSGGSGILLSKKDGKWSGPHAITIGGVQFGFGAGMSKADTMIILKSDEALNSFAKGVFKIGGNMQFAAGPSGIDYSYSNLKLEQGWEPAYTYNFCEGAYFAMALEGIFFYPTNTANRKYYGKEDIVPSMILSHKVKVPVNLRHDKLIKKLDKLIQHSPKNLEEFRNQTFFRGERVFFVEGANKKVYGTISGEMRSQCYRIYADDSSNKQNFYFPAVSIQRVVEAYDVGTHVMVNFDGQLKKGLIKSEKKDSHYLVAFDNDDAISVPENLIVKSISDEKTSFTKPSLEIKLTPPHGTLKLASPKNPRSGRTARLYERRYSIDNIFSPAQLKLRASQSMIIIRPKNHSNSLNENQSHQLLQNLKLLSDLPREEQSPRSFSLVVPNSFRLRASQSLVSLRKRSRSIDTSNFSERKRTNSVTRPGLISPLSLKKSRHLKKNKPGAKSVKFETTNAAPLPGLIHVSQSLPVLAKKSCINKSHRQVKPVFEIRSDSAGDLTNINPVIERQCANCGTLNPQNFIMCKHCKHRNQWKLPA